MLFKNRVLRIIIIFTSLALIIWVLNALSLYKEHFNSQQADGITPAVGRVIVSADVVNDITDALDDRAYSDLAEDRDAIDMIDSFKKN